MTERGAVRRERLLARLQTAVTHRLTLVVADPGFGKTELLEQWLQVRRRDAAVLVRPESRDLPGIAGALVEALVSVAPEQAHPLGLVVRTRVNEPEALAGMIGTVLACLPGTHLLLVVDNAHLMAEPAQRLVDSLLRQTPPTLHVLLLTRFELPFSTDRLADPVQRFDGTDLGFDDAEISELMKRVVGDDEHAAAVQAFLGRWPAALRMAAEKLSQVAPDRRTAELVRLKKQGERGLLELAQEVIAAEPEANRRLAQVVAPYDGFSAELAEALGCTGAHRVVDELVSRGILVRVGRDAGIDYYAFPRLLRQFLRATQPLPAEERPGLVRRAGAWFEQNGQAESALRCALDQRDSPWVARLLREHGRALVERGRGARVESALQLLAEDERDAAIWEVEGVLHESRGDHLRALEHYDEASRRRGGTSPWLAYRIGFLQYFRGNLIEALRAFTGAAVLRESADNAVLLAWQATVHWAMGDPDAAERVAAEAMELAVRLGDPRALAATHTIAAMLRGHRGDRGGSHEHYDLALAHAQAAGDVEQVVRIRNNRSAMLLEEAELARALPEADAAIELAAAGGLSFYLSAALTNRGEIRYHQGQYDEAVADLERARDLDQAAGNGSSATRIYLGRVYRHRGYANAARLAFDQVLAAGRSTQDATLVVPALCGLAQLLADSEPRRAQELVDEALRFDAGVNSVGVLTTAAWVGYAQDRRDEAASFAERARAEAVARRDRIGEAEALLLLTLCDIVLQQEDPRLARAAALLEEVGAPVWLARVRLEQARRLPAAEAVAVVAEVERLAATLGARDLADRAAALARRLDTSNRVPHVEVLTLGGFRVRRSGRALGLADWPDESAVALLERLTSRTPTAWTRTSLQRSLWPGVSAEQAQPLLDQAVEQLRRTLDPGHTFEREQFVLARGDAVVLQGVEVDVHAFLADARAGLAGDRDLLRRAEARYTGDYLEEHPGEPWTQMLREEARSRYVEVARALAAQAVRDGEFEAAARFSRRILERDPYDENAHLSLVAALASSGREQEARACYATYAARNDELGLEAVPWALVRETVTAA